MAYIEIVTVTAPTVFAFPPFFKFTTPIILTRRATNRAELEECAKSENFERKTSGWIDGQNFFSPFVLSHFNLVAYSRAGHFSIPSCVDKIFLKGKERKCSVMCELHSD